MRRDGGESQVIAAVLMTAVAVAIAASAYVAVSRIQTGSAQPESIAVSLVSNANGLGILSVASVSEDFAWKELRIATREVTQYGIYAHGSYVADWPWNDSAATGTIAAGDVIQVSHRSNLTSMSIIFVDLDSGAVLADAVIPLARDASGPRIVTATKTNPVQVTFTETVYMTRSFSNARSVWEYTDTNLDGDQIDNVAYSLSAGSRTVTIPLEAGDVPDAGDRIVPKDGRFYDAGGNHVSVSPFTFP